MQHMATSKVCQEAQQLREKVKSQDKVTERANIDCKPTAHALINSYFQSSLHYAKRKGYKGNLNSGPPTKIERLIEGAISQKLGMSIEMKGDCGIDWLPYSRGASEFDFDDHS